MSEYVNIQDLIEKIKEHKHKTLSSFKEEGFNVGIDAVVLILKAIEQDERNYPQIKRK